MSKPKKRRRRYTFANPRGRYEVEHYVTTLAVFEIDGSAMVWRLVGTHVVEGTLFFAWELERVVQSIPAQTWTAKRQPKAASKKK